VVNVICEFLPWFCIFKVVQNCEMTILDCPNQGLAWQCKEKTWIIIFLLKEFKNIFKKFVWSGMFQIDNYFLILDGYGLQVILKLIK